MRKPKQEAARQRLRRTIDSLPERTRDAMLQSVRNDRIIVGAYTAPKGGGVCPMLGAHRRGGRTDISSFARAWDSYTKAVEGQPRPATERELRSLQLMLESSLARERPQTKLSAAVEEIKAERDRLAKAAEAKIARWRADQAEVKSRRAERRAKDASWRASQELEQQQAAAEAQKRPRVDTGERDRSGELGAKPGWSWLRPFRSVEEMQAVFTQLREQGEDAVGAEEEQADGSAQADAPREHERV